MFASQSGVVYIQSNDGREGVSKEPLCAMANVAARVSLHVSIALVVMSRIKGSIKRTIRQAFYTSMPD